MSKSGKKAAQKQSQRDAEFWSNIAREFLGTQRGLSEDITPFAQRLLQFGLDPAAFLQSAQGQSLLAPLQQATAKNFEGARVSLADQMAGSGTSNAAPFANLLGQEAGAQSQNVMQLIAQSLGLGQAGAGILQGQQQIFDPFRAGALAQGNLQGILSQQPSGILNALIGAGGQALSGFFGSKKEKK